MKAQFWEKEGNILFSCHDLGYMPSETTSTQVYFKLENKSEVEGVRHSVFKRVGRKNGRHIGRGQSGEMASNQRGATAPSRPHLSKPNKKGPGEDLVYLLLQPKRLSCKTCINTKFRLFSESEV